MTTKVLFPSLQMSPGKGKTDLVRYGKETLDENEGNLCRAVSWDKLNKELI